MDEFASSDYEAPSDQGNEHEFPESPEAAAPGDPVVPRRGGGRRAQATLGPLVLFFVLAGEQGWCGELTSGVKKSKWFR